MTRRSLFTLIFLIACGRPPVVLGNDPVDPKLPTLRLVLFTPKGVDPPPNAQERLTQIAKYTEDFYIKWMTHWGYKPTQKHMFQWKPDGHVEVLFFQGDKGPTEYPDGSFRPAMMQKLAKQHNIPQNNNINWVFVYLGDPPARYDNFKGSGNSKAGGWAMANFDSSPGEIRTDRGIAEGFHDDFALKGCIHELGHGLGLPHIGPRLKRDLGNSLMGPINRIWRQYLGPKDQRGYLTEASAAMLYKHPLFSGTSKDRDVMPDVSLKSFQAQYDRTKKVATIHGQLVSQHKAHSVIIVDDMDNKPGDYWVRAYVGRVNEKGEFDVVLDELVDCGGTLRILFCFENGTTTGNGKTHGLQSAIEKPYRYTRKSHQFD
ncbi:MAG: hypothetical protein R3C01_06105 [Planctomycetaceae bacterium]